MADALSKHLCTVTLFHIGSAVDQHFPVGAIALCRGFPIQYPRKQCAITGIRAGNPGVQAVFFQIGFIGHSLRTHSHTPGHHIGHITGKATFIIYAGAAGSENDLMNLCPSRCCTSGIGQSIQRQH